MGYIKKFSKFAEKINSKYLIYIKEINDYIISASIRKEKENTISKEDAYLYFIQGFIYFFGFKNIEGQNFFKAIEYLDKGNFLTDKIFMKKIIELTKYNIKELMYNNKDISIDELTKFKTDLIDYFYKNPYLKNQVFDCNAIGEDFFKGITRKKDEFIALLIYNSTQNIFCQNIIDCFAKTNIKKILKDNENKIENIFKDEICSIFYTNKVNRVFIPCKHYFCTDKLEEDSKKCPICRTEYLCII